MRLLAAATAHASACCCGNCGEGVMELKIGNATYRGTCHTDFLLSRLQTKLLPHVPRIPSKACLEYEVDTGAHTPVSGWQAAMQLQPCASRFRIRDCKERTSLRSVGRSRAPGELIRIRACGSGLEQSFQRADRIRACGEKTSRFLCGWGRLVCKSTQRGAPMGILRAHG